jgi:hypothetical protein
VTLAGGLVPGSRHPATLQVSAISDVIAAKELERLDQGLSLMDLIAHARPWFLHPRGGVSTVSINGAPPAELAVLRTLSVHDVKEIRLLRPTGKSGPVAMRPGMISIGDVILVTTGVRGP